MKASPPALYVSLPVSSFSFEIEGVPALHDPRGLLGGPAELGLPVAVHHLAAGGGDQRVEPHDEALVAAALHHDLAFVAADLLGHLDHLVPRLRRRGHELLVVEEKLGVGGERRHPRLVLVLRSGEQGGDHAVLGDVLVRAGPGHDPAGLGELGGPVHVHADHVEVLVLGGQPAGDQLALLVGVSRQRDDLDPVLAVRLLGALGRRGVERSARLLEDVPLHVL
jgi:hypothetical protein